LRLLFCLLFFVTLGYSQAEASHWYFGNGAGLIFDTNSGTVLSTNAATSTISTSEGCSSISDLNGNLLFYTDGRNIWDKNHIIMPNANYNAGTGLLGDPSSTSSGLIIPKPGNTDQYYVFTVDEPHHQNAFAFPNQGPANVSGNAIGSYDSGGSVPSADDGFNNGLAYTLVDLTLNSGDGDVVTSEKNIQLLTYDPNDQSQAAYKCSEKITAVEHNDGQSYWVLTQFINKFYAFRVDDSGVNPMPVTTTISPSITVQGFRRNGIGYMKASPDGSKIAVCHRQNGNSEGQNSSNTGSVWLYDFDNETGLISNPLNIYPNSGPYGVEFSPEATKLYVTGDDSVFQFDLEAPNPAATISTVYSGFDFIGALQLGPDGKIYAANTGNQAALDIINAPEELGVLCDYNNAGIALAPGTSAVIGLPPFIQSFFLASIVVENNCFGESTQFNVSTSQAFDQILWNFGDGLPTGTSSAINPSYNYANPGTYTVTAEITSGTEINTFSQTITINVNPMANAAADLEECDDDGDGIFAFNFVETQTEVLGSQDPNNFTLSFHENLTDAEDNANPLSIPYQNSISSETIFVRIENNVNRTCFDTTSFNLTVFDTPIANSVATVQVCDDLNDGDDANGQKATILTDFDATILGSQDNSLYNITYHLTQAEANNNTNALASPYYNANPFAFQIFARIENRLKTDCFDTTEFTVNVNPIPEALDANLIQCDEDGVNDGLTSFNLAEANDNLNGGVTNRTVKFYSSLSDAQNSLNAINASPFANTTNPQILYAQVVDNATGCFNISVLTLNVSLTSGSDEQLQACDADGIEDGLTNFNLTLASPGILSGLPSDYNLMYYETYQDALLETSPLGDNFTNTTPYNQMIYARIENNNQCFGINELELTVFRLPQLGQGNQTFFCTDPNALPVFIDSGVIGNPSDYNYLWSSGQTTHQIQINQGGNYTVIVTNSNGCTQSQNINVLNSNIAVIESIEINDASDNNTVTVNVTGEGDYEYAIDNAFGPYQDDNTFFNVSPGFHSIYVRDKNNCGIADEMISVIGFPKFFTPNNDGYNDTWHVYGINTDNQVGSEIFIFDRFGKLLNRLRHNGQGWDGTYNGNPMPTADYWFYIKLNDNRIFRGHFTLKR
jgi:gliding motility-associated-like protein